MVDGKLDKFVSEMGIPEEVFVAACEAASQKVHQSIVK
jgi:hypothetical protein